MATEFFLALGQHLKQQFINHVLAADPVAANRPRNSRDRTSSMQSSCATIFHAGSRPRGCGARSGGGTSSSRPSKRRR